MISELGTLLGGEHYLAFMLVVTFSCALLGKNILSSRVNQSSFWLTILACALLIAQDVVEKYAQADPARINLRVITSIVGYSLRPVAVLGFLLAVWPRGKMRGFLWIPVILNALLYCTALVLPLTFYIDSENAFHRGPLGITMFVVCIVYLILVFFVIHKRFRDRRAGEMLVIYLCALGCLGSIAVDVTFGDITIISAILISSMTFYQFLRSQDIDHDSLTHLWTRRIFYEDCTKHRNAINAVCSIDMNGLKKTNDELGHDAGDRALRQIGRGLRAISSRKILAYRIGGDEFILLFLHCDQDEIRQSILAFLDDMSKAGLSVAVGMATRLDSNESLDELIRVSDQRMYEDKSEHYRIHDRRRQR